MQDYLHQEISIIICTVLPALPLQPFALRADTAPWRVFYFSAVGMSPKLCGTCADTLPVIAAWLAFIHWFTMPGITNLIADLTGTVGLTWGSVWMHYKWHRQVQVMYGRGRMPCMRLCPYDSRKLILIREIFNNQHIFCTNRLSVKYSNSTILYPLKSFITWPTEIISTFT